MKLQTATNPFAGLEEIVTEDVPLAPHTWYKIGGPARFYVQPRTPQELKDAARRCVENGIRIHVLGLGANLLVGDAGVDGAVFRLDADHLRQGKYLPDHHVEVGAGVDLQKLVLSTVRKGLAGIECMAGIPGTIGGGIRMNAGGKYGDLGAFVTKVWTMDSEGNAYERLKDDIVFEYRRTNISAPFITGAVLELEPDDPEKIMRRTKEIWMYKRNSQPLNAKSAGCMFKNPRGLSAGALIDQAGLKGFRVGGAEVSTKHANFVVAHPGCKADDILRLVKIIKEKVAEKNDVVLESEVQVWA
ncbi:MAG TPA: UDP-N-acetylmuramate dehydrogenase [Tepidisphaeraceae bacterium]|nr:UDP-N-acetylmuramate dehydrogenase [Tepidisphaeraceae bacterium]